MTKSKFTKLVRVYISRGKTGWSWVPATYSQVRLCRFISPGPLLSSLILPDSLNSWHCWDLSLWLLSQTTEYYKLTKNSFKQKKTWVKFNPELFLLRRTRKGWEGKSQETAVLQLIQTYLLGIRYSQR